MPLFRRIVVNNDVTIIRFTSQGFDLDHQLPVCIGQSVKRLDPLHIGQEEIKRVIKPGFINMERYDILPPEIALSSSLGTHLES